jgi:hypothetical protein
VRFPSKKGIILVPFLIFFTIFNFATAILSFMADEPGSAVLPVLIALFIIWLLLTTGYKIEDKTLSIKAAFINKQINIKTIRSVRPTKNPLSSPALSIDRLEIVYQSGMDEKITLISPKEKEKFISKLKELNPNIKVLD